MDKIIQLIAKAREPAQEGNCLVVPTDCLYFDGEVVFVDVNVSPCGEKITISDMSGAVDRIHAAGRAPERDVDFRSLKSDYGVEITGDYQLRLSTVSVNDVYAGISVIANASVALADQLFDHLESTSSQEGLRN